MTESDQTLKNASAPPRPAVELPETLRITLTCTKGSVEGKMFRVRKSPTLIGRTQGDILINDPTLSSRHAEIRVVEKKVMITDLKSTNGTRINGQKVQTGELRNLSGLALGAMEFNVNIIEDQYMIGAEAEQAADPVGESTYHLTDVVGSAEDLKALEVPRELINDTRKLRIPPSAEPAPLKGVTVHLGIAWKDTRRIVKLANKSTVVGHKEGDVLLEDDTVSAKHFQIEIMGNEDIRLKDLASTNGTLVNNKPASVEAVKDGDWIKVGETFIKVMVKTETTA